MLRDREDVTRAAAAGRRDALRNGHSLGRSAGAGRRDAQARSSRRLVRSQVEVVRAGQGRRFAHEEWACAQVSSRDIAFRHYVFCHAYPQPVAQPCLVLVDKSQTTTVNGLNQRFRIRRRADRRSEVIVLRMRDPTANGDHAAKATHVERWPWARPRRFMLKRDRANGATEISRLLPGLLHALSKHGSQHPPATVCQSDSRYAATARICSCVRSFTMPCITGAERSTFCITSICLNRYAEC